MMRKTLYQSTVHNNYRHQGGWITNLCGKCTSWDTPMELPPGKVLIQETPCTFHPRHPTNMPTDSEYPQVWRMYVWRYYNTYLEDQVSYQPWKTPTGNWSRWMCLCRKFGIIHTRFHWPTEGKTYQVVILRRYNILLSLQWSQRYAIPE